MGKKPRTEITQRDLSWGVGGTREMKRDSCLGIERWHYGFLSARMSGLRESAGYGDQPQRGHRAAQARSQLASSLHLSTHACRQSPRDTGAAVGGLVCGAGVALAGGVAADTTGGAIGVEEAVDAAGVAAATVADARPGVADPAVAEVGSGGVSVAVGGAGGVTADGTTI